MNNLDPSPYPAFLPNTTDVLDVITWKGHTLQIRLIRFKPINGYCWGYYVNTAMTLWEDPDWMSIAGPWFRGGFQDWTLSEYLQRVFGDS